ncbi:MAG: SDR family oxidoreductase [bacterium]|nr:SDR family oxidoreductase [bacterium]
MTKINIITGASGFIGRHLVKQLLEKGEIVYAIIRNDPQNNKSKKIFPNFYKIYGNLFKVISGDITKKNLEIQPNILKEIQEIKNDIIFWHLAANLSFCAKNKKTIFEDNLGGTQQVINFVNSMPITTLCYMSTAFICGSKYSNFSEDKLQKKQKFHNAYESSKFVAENLVRNKCKKQYIIFRPSIVIGDAYEGKAIGCTFGYYRFIYVIFVFKNWLIKNIDRPSLLFKILSFFFPIKYDKNTNVLYIQRMPFVYPRKCTVNIIQLDFVIDSMITISKQCKINKTFNLTHPNPPSFCFLFKEVINALEIRGTLLVPIHPKIFSFIIKTGYLLFIPLRKYFDSAKKYLPYTTINYKFCTKNTIAYGLIPPIISESYLKKINSYAIKNIFLQKDMHELK